MKKQTYILILLAILLSLVYFFYQNIANDTEKNSKSIITRVCIKTDCFDVEIANTPQKREIGLMNLEFLAQDSGMLFVFEDEGIYSFWMKNTLIPLDIVWIDKNFKIVFIENNVQPCKVKKCEFFRPDKKAKYVLEINKGLADEGGFKVGDKIKIE